jgi:hypothetical protein
VSVIWHHEYTRRRQPCRLCRAEIGASWDLCAECHETRLALDVIRYTERQRCGP